MQAKKELRGEPDMDRLKAYSILGLHVGAGEEEIKTAYRALAQKYSADNYEAGPLRDEAGQKMNEINEAFDALMSYIRTGSPTSSETVSSGTRADTSRYAAIRKLINEGNTDEALQELTTIGEGSSDAEWNFLMGSVYYYKGWLDNALRYFQEAVRLEPGNHEYEAALRNLQGSKEGNMQGNPYMNQDPSGAAINCACNTCTLMCCMDACCSSCGGC